MCSHSPPWQIRTSLAVSRPVRVRITVIRFAIPYRDMMTITRREFAWTAAALALTARSVSAATNLDDILRTGIQRRKIPAVAAMVATRNKIIYQAAFGERDVESGVNVTPESIFSIASMTKAITSTAALQLVEQ